MNKNPNVRRDEDRRPGERPDDGNAFVPDTTGTAQPLPASDAEAFAEEFIGSATGAEPAYMTAEDEVVDDEEGGPFIVLDENAALPPEPVEAEAEAEAEPVEAEAEREGHEPVQERDARRGANWAAKGV